MPIPPPPLAHPQRTSLLADLLAALPQLHPQLYFKSSLVALSHAMEDQVLSGQSHPVVFANFQKERYYRQEARRYQRISQIAEQVYVLAMPETDFSQTPTPYQTVALDEADPLTQEWHLIVLDPAYATCLVCRERLLRAPSSSNGRDPDMARQFEGIWSFDPPVAYQAALHLIPKILAYRPDLYPLLDGLRNRWEDSVTRNGYHLNPAPFAERLITYLQAGQYKLQRTYKAIQLQERKERLVNRISTAIRRSLDPSQILHIAVQELGQATAVARCLIYRCQRDQAYVQVKHEYCQPDTASLQTQDWLLAGNPFLQEAMTAGEFVLATDSSRDPRLATVAWQTWGIGAWLAVPMLYQDRLLGLLELHQAQPQPWDPSVVELAEGIAFQVGVALIQAEAYQHLDELNHQLAALDQAKSDLIAVTGHELRTPLSTIQVCLESLAADPDMPLAVRQEMLDTALQDAGRLRQLVQDFLTLSKLESGRIQWHIEAVSPEECVELAVSNLNARRRQQVLPSIDLELPEGLPWVSADGEWLVEVLRKLLDNACKFTPAEGQIWVRVSQPSAGQMERIPGIPTVRFTIADTGRGIAQDRLEAIFDRFYQAEGSLRRSVGGTGLGLAICRLIIEAMGGQIWAESAGEQQGSAFHFVLPVAGLKSGGLRGEEKGSQAR
ncbi:MAG: DICT sensory domain-containing protein [Cyanobacteriota bacterium]|nr:DICT sensory domain-containing protein [Cyanobacteriota bacterium]